jgi:hypothetical protein
MSAGAHIHVGVVTAEEMTQERADDGEEEPDPETDRIN